MPEGLLGGILGEEQEKPEAEAAGALARAEAFAATVAAKLADSDPQVARDTSAFLQEQTRLLKVQKEHLEDEHALRLTHLRHQSRLLHGQRWAQNLRIAFQCFAAVVAGVIGGGLLLMLHDAFTSRSVVVHPFDTPPALVARGVTGKVVAAGVLDELVRLQTATRADAAKRQLSNAWSNEIKLDIPETGFTLGELSRLLKARFGHDLHIEGELVQPQNGGFALTVRGDGVAPKTLTAPAAGFDKMISEAAEHVYSQSEPVLWAYYLVDAGRNEEAIAFSRDAFARAGKEDRPYLLNTWANALTANGRTREALALYRNALKLKPDYWNAHYNVMEDLIIMGDEEGAWRAGKQMETIAGGRPGNAPEIDYEQFDHLVKNITAWHDSIIADAESHGGVGSDTLAAGVQIADTETQLHNPAAADLALQTIPAENTDSVVAAVAHFVRGRLAAEAGDVSHAVAEMEAFGAAYSNPNVSSNSAGYNCWVAPAEEAAGHPDKADAVLKTAGTYVDCYRFRGDILDGRGDWTGAQKAYADAVALAPDLPAAHYSWGLALVRHGDLAGAAGKLEDANQRGPHWADPLKAWGDVLVKQGHVKEALAKYDEALKYAPNWAALKEARDAAAKHGS
jgi:tetratricopeptide (TPR) repeat protein